MIKKSYGVLALALTMALAVAGIAFADGASVNTAYVDGSVKPKKLDKKKYKPVSLFVGVRTEGPTDTRTAFNNPANEYISFGKNVKLDLSKGDECPSGTLPPSGSTPEQAKAACPPDSYLGSGEARVQGPPIPPIFPGDANDIVVSVFKGPANNEVMLHTYSPTLLAAAPTVNGEIVDSNRGSKYGQALVVDPSPVTGSLMITKFNATIEKSSKVATARCKAKKFLWERVVQYTNDTGEVANPADTETATLEQKCKQKKKK